jgi:hypothetical protein
MRISTFISFVGFVMVFVATFCPIAHFIINQNIYQLNQPYGLVFLLVTVIGVISTVLNNLKLTKLMAWIIVAMVVLFYIAALIKIHSYFNFIPFHFFSGYLSGKIKFKWGWYMMCAGALLTLIGLMFRKNNTFASNKTSIG